MKYYKVLGKHGRSCHGGNAEWSLPTQNDDGTWTPGEWMPEIEGELEPCRNGYHVVTGKVLVKLRKSCKKFEPEEKGRD